MLRINSQDLPPAQLPLTAIGLAGFFFGEPINNFIGAKNVIPPVNAEAKVVMPHVVLVMDVVNGHLHPEALGRIFVLKLVGIGGKGRVGDRANHPTKTNRNRDQKRWKHHQKRALDVIAKLPQHPLAFVAAVMIPMPFAKL